MELNPVRAGLVPDAADWRWSSARAHLSGRDDALVRVAPLLAMVADWQGFLSSGTPEEELCDLREHGRSGYPLGSATFEEDWSKSSVADFARENQVVPRNCSNDHNRFVPPEFRVSESAGICGIPASEFPCRIGQPAYATNRDEAGAKPSLITVHALTPTHQRPFQHFTQLSDSHRFCQHEIRRRRGLLTS